MSEKNTRKQIRTLYLMTTVGYFQIAAADRDARKYFPYREPLL